MVLQRHERSSTLAALRSIGTAAGRRSCRWETGFVGPHWNSGGGVPRTRDSGAARRERLSAKGGTESRARERTSCELLETDRDTRGEAEEVIVFEVATVLGALIDERVEPAPVDAQADMACEGVGETDASAERRVGLRP